MSVDLRPFPMQYGPPIPWYVAEAIYKHLYRHPGQSLERLAERGGFSWREVDWMWGVRRSGAAVPSSHTTDAHREACRAEIESAAPRAASRPPIDQSSSQSGEGDG